MSVSIYRDVLLGDMLVRYYLDSESGNMELQLLPAGMLAGCPYGRVRAPKHFGF